MVNKSMRCGAKAAENAAMRLRSADAGETGSPEAAEVSPSAASATQPEQSLLQAHAVMHRVTSEIISLSSYTLAIGPDAVFTHDAPKKWYYACSKYALLEVGIQLMLTHQCKNLSDVESVDFQSVCPSIARLWTNTSSK